MSAIFWTFAEHHLEFDTENDSEPITIALSMKTVFRNNAKTKHTVKKTPNTGAWKRRPGANLTCWGQRTSGLVSGTLPMWGETSASMKDSGWQSIPNKDSWSSPHSSPRKLLEDDSYFLST